jgi:hypothetical protein
MFFSFDLQDVADQNAITSRNPSTLIIQAKEAYKNEYTSFRKIKACGIIYFGFSVDYFPEDYDMYTTWPENYATFYCVNC